MTILDYKNNKRVNYLSGKYKGKVSLIVNTTTKCLFTPKLINLQKWEEKVREQGFQILAFPSNQFADQKPLRMEKNAEFCVLNHGVYIPIFKKMYARGDDALPLFTYLFEQKPFDVLKMTILFQIY